MSHHSKCPNAIAGVAYGYEGQNMLNEALNYANQALAVAEKDHPYYDYFVDNLACLKGKVEGDDKAD